MYPDGFNPSVKCPECGETARVDELKYVDPNVSLLSWLISVTLIVGLTFAVAAAMKVHLNHWWIFLMTVGISLGILLSPHLRLRHMRVLLTFAIILAALVMGKPGFGWLVIVLIVIWGTKFFRTVR